ncbi:MAG: WecB/TagA/CpsF family glycosyltransferase [Bacteroidetes bacterium]|nr:WecB/TagA/CpsF family glycosyltransferase [Bacteroidota bacterium]
MNSFDKITLFGFDLTSAASVDDIAADAIKHYGSGSIGDIAFLITPNASTVVYYNEPKHLDLKEHYAHSAYILPDGMPLVWLSRSKAKQPLRARLTGSDLFPTMWRHIKDLNIPVTMVLANETLAARYRDDYSNCVILVPSFFDAGDEAYIQAFAAKVAEAVTQNNSRFLFLGLNFPKQERLGIQIALSLKEKKFKGPLLILLLGASFEFYFGLKKRAPAIFRKTGMEWFYRFMSEPGRLWKRYTVDNIRFIALAIKEILKKPTNS